MENKAADFLIFFLLFAFNDNLCFLLMNIEKAYKLDFKSLILVKQISYSESYTSIVEVALNCCNT